MQMYTGVAVVEVDSDLINSLYDEKQVHISYLPEGSYWQNQYIVLKAITITGESQSAICRIKKDQVVLVNTKNLDKGKVSGLKPRNKEQEFAMDALLDDSVKVVCMTGTAGTGKTLLALAAAMHLVENGYYNRIILTRPMSQVGAEATLGFLPGDVDEKFLPFLSNYFDNMEQLVGGNRKRGKQDQKFDYEQTMRMYNIECIPLALIRGASWVNAIILADEIQILPKHEMLTLGTRVGETSKLILMGDLKQIDGNIRFEQTGLYKFVNSDLVKDSELVASIHLLKSERGPVPRLFASVFEE